MPGLEQEEVSAGDPIGLLAGSATVLAVGPLTNVAEAELFSFATGRILVEDDGLIRFTADPAGPHRIVTDLDPERVTRRIVDRTIAAITCLRVQPTPRSH